jgi:hypothetical protein
VVEPSRELQILAGTYAACRLDPGDPVPAWADGAELVSVTRTADELSVIAAEAAVPAGVECERGWRCLKARGPLDFSLVGIAASLTVPLADEGIPVLVLSTYETDLVLVRDADLARANRALERAGWRVTGAAGHG